MMFVSVLRSKSKLEDTYRETKTSGILPMFDDLRICASGFKFKFMRVCDC